MEPLLEDKDLAPIMARLSSANKVFDAQFPGIALDRIPVHTLYGGAHLFKHTAPAKLSGLAQQHFATYAPDAQAFARALDLSSSALTETVYRRVLEKLDREAIEDQRLDFEDGYGARADAEEDGHAHAAALELAEGVRAGSLPSFIGIRIKSLSEETRDRSVRTLDIFIRSFCEQQVELPSPFFVTLPKVTHPDQVTALVDVVELLESHAGLAPGSISIEILIETTQSVIGPSGINTIPSLIEAGRGRITSAILGTYDYTASCNIASHYQDHRHPAADFARQIMQVCLTGTAVNICDGITNTMPIAPHRGNALSDDQHRENREVVHLAWRIHFNNILHSLRLGFYQGWDLNPAQLPIRFAACYYFFLEGLDDAGARLTTFIDQATQASMVGNTFDDAASAQGLLNYFVNGINCGALTESEALSTGITLEELQARSFQQIVKNRLGSNHG